MKTLESQWKEVKKMNLIIENTKAILQERGLKQKAFAKKAGYTEQKFTRKMSGRSPITWKDILNIANALGITPNELFGIKIEEDA
ncbi:MAG: helix-turn-helix domain-containing protein [Oscillospiraceae bacterium]|nr:helix-turn-helix domain-containing protein [Oscillospiraceae bacterium]